MQSRQSLELRQQQQLALTPQLQQSLRFLQLSTYELEQEVAQALLDNPLLETDTPDGALDTVADIVTTEDENWSAAPSQSQGNAPQSDDDFERPEPCQIVTLQGYLLEQLHLTRATERDMALVEWLVNELDENGYLGDSLESILASFPVLWEVSAEELLAALRLLQSFDPPGVGARGLSECLVLQIKRKPDYELDERVRACALRIAEHHLEWLAAGQLARLCEALECDQHTLRAAHALVLTLDPRPGRPWATSVADFAVPDVLVRKQGTRWQVSLNTAVMPRLRVNADYAQALESLSPSEAMEVQLQQAYGVIKSVSQRFATILRVTQAIVDRQHAFFEQGMGAMRPLVLREIADTLGMHESTVSRATKQKFVQTPWGVIELKRFFGTAVQTDDGESTSATAVQALIRELVEQEPASKPLSDSQLVLRLADQGIVVARRTVAKYREVAGIAPASLRKARHSLNVP